MEKGLYKVSVLMPVYNVEKYLAEAIESIISQHFNDFELIIVDDGSTDDSLAIAEQFSARDKRVQVYSQVNQGISRTRNKLLSLAKGEYIAWMDSDDISPPNRLMIQVGYLDNHPRTVAVGSWAMMVDEVNADLTIWQPPIEHEHIDGRHIKGQGGNIVFASSMMRKEAVVQAGGFDDNLVGSEDLDLFLRLAEIGVLANVPEILLRYRQHVKSISHKQIDRIAKDNLNIVKKAHIRRNIAFDENKIFSVIDSGDKTQENSNISFADTYNKWAWWALQSRHVKTARKYAIKSLIEKPSSLAYWKTLVCAIRGY